MSCANQGEYICVKIKSLTGNGKKQNTNKLLNLRMTFGSAGHVITIGQSEARASSPSLTHPNNSTSALATFSQNQTKDFVCLKQSMLLRMLKDL